MTRTCLVRVDDSYIDWIVSPCDWRHLREERLHTCNIHCCHCTRGRNVSFSGLQPYSLGYFISYTIIKAVTATVGIVITCLVTKGACVHLHVCVCVCVITATTRASYKNHGVAVAAHVAARCPSSPSSSCSCSNPCEAPTAPDPPPPPKQHSTSRAPVVALWRPNRRLV
jgi:hypothetical protein